MGFFYSVFAPIAITIAFVYNNLLIIFLSLIVAAVAAFLVSYYFFAFAPNSSDSLSVQPSPQEETKKRVSTIAEVENEDADEDELTSQQRRRMRKRDWAKKIYKSLVQQDSPLRTPSDESSNESLYTSDLATNRKRSFSRRRHSSGPFQLAKDLIRRGSQKYFRDKNVNYRGARPLPPSEFFEPTDLPEVPTNLQPEIFYILHNLKMLELPDEWKLNPREIEVKSYQEGEYVVKPGDPDDSIYVSIDGTLSVHIKHMEGKEYLVKRIAAGGSFFSFLSMLDILMEYPSVLKSVSLKATEPCRVARFPITSFRESYINNPEAWIRPIQIVITRLLHVTLTTLHQYMGLSSELMKRSPHVSSKEKIRSGSISNRLPIASLGKKKDKTFNHNDSVEDQLTLAQKWLAEAFSLNEDSHENIAPPVETISIKTYEPGSILIEQGSEEEVLMLVLHGNVILTQWFLRVKKWKHGGILDLRLILADVAGFRHDRVIVFGEKWHIADQLAGESASFLLFTKILSLLQTGSGFLAEVPLFDEEEHQEDAVIRVGPKELIGGLQLLTNEPSFYTIRATVKTTVAVMSKLDFSTFLESRPQIYLPVAHSVLRRLSPFLRGVDFALDWVLVDSGGPVYKAGDDADSMFVVLSGRLRSVEKKTIVKEEFGRGDVLGMIEVLTKKPRSTTVLAVRFSQLARVPEGLLSFIKLQFPQVGFRLVQLLGQFYYGNHSTRSTSFPSPTSLHLNETSDPVSHIKNLHTIAVVPASTDVPLVPFTCELYHALSTNLKVLRLSSQKIAACLDPGVLEKRADFRLMHWLNVQEDTYPLVIYECDYAPTNWTRRCLRQADAILVVGLGGKKTEKQTLMRDLMNVNQDGVRTSKELILLWPESTKTPSGTVDWLKNSYFAGHHHVRAPKRMFQWRKPRKSSRSGEPFSPFQEKEIIEYYEKNVFWTKDRRSDFARLARILTGNAIGLVLGGGGARGAAHVGVLKALKEQGIPVDIIGGTSIGSMIGGLYAETPDEKVVEERASSWFQAMSSLWRKIYDLTYWHSAMFTGAQFNKSIRDLFDERLIEDLWISYFCVSTDISMSEMRIHRNGPLWSYCRASMSLAGYLPPLCDPRDSHLLLDGGYVNNLPADVMRSLGARCVIAVDVGSIEETNLTDYGDHLSGFWVLARRLNPFGEPVRILNMEEIQSRLAYVSCVRQLEVVKKAPYCQYLRPPIEPFKTLDFGRFENILKIGYNYGKDKVEKMLHDETLRASLLGEEKETWRFKRQQSKREKTSEVSRAVSFTDLAAAISKIPSTRPTLLHSMSLNPGSSGRDGDVICFDEDLWADNESSHSEDLSESEQEDEIERSSTPRPL